MTQQGRGVTYFFLGKLEMIAFILCGVIYLFFLSFFFQNFPEHVSSVYLGMVMSLLCVLTARDVSGGNELKFADDSFINLVPATHNKYPATTIFFVQQKCNFSVNSQLK